MNEPVVSDSGSGTDSDSGSDVDEILGSFTEQIQQLEPALSAVEAQIAGINKRLVAAQRDWIDTPMTPRTVAVKDWCRSHGLGSHPTLRTWFATLLTTALVADCETRTFRLLPDDAAVWSDGKPSVALFDLLRKVPEWFVLPAVAA